MADSLAPTERTRIVREPQRAVYDRVEIYKILDEGFVCHLGFTADSQTFVIPTMYARVGDFLYFHGSAASRMLRSLSNGVSVCVTVTLLDGLVLARSVFNHSMNYRSVVALGTATLVDEPSEKLDALRAFTEKILLGRWNDARQPNDKELKATSIVVTHDIVSAIYVGDRLALLRDGKIVHLADPDSFLKIDDPLIKFLHRTITDPRSFKENHNG